MNTMAVVKENVCSSLWGYEVFSLFSVLLSFLFLPPPLSLLSLLTSLPFLSSEVGRTFPPVLCRRPGEAPGP
jgi:hypothetical protein